MPPRCRWPRGLPAASGPWVFAPRLPISRPARPRHAYTATPTPISCRTAWARPTWRMRGPRRARWCRHPLCRHRCRRACRHRRVRRAGSFPPPASRFRRWCTPVLARRGCWRLRACSIPRPPSWSRPPRRCVRPALKRRAAGILVRPRRPRRTWWAWSPATATRPSRRARWPARCAGTPTTSPGPRR